MKALFQEVKGAAFSSKRSLWTVSEEREETDSVERETVKK